MGSTDSTLLDRWMKHRDADAFSELLARHSAMVRATCLRILRNESDAEDIVQDCFVKLSTLGETIHSSVGGWLHAAATSRSLDRLRSDTRRVRRDTAYADHQDGAADVAWEEIQEHIDDAIATLPPKYRQPLVAHFLEGRTYDQLAGDFEIPRSTAAYRVQQGVALIRRELSRRRIEIGATALVTGAMCRAETLASAAALPSGVRELLDVEYGRVGGVPLRLDLLFPARLTGPAPTLVCVHGGGWNGGTKRDIRCFAIPYTQKGYVVACVGYRLAPQAAFPAPVQDVQCAVRWLRTNAARYRINPGAITLAGWSAGAHLALMAAYTADGSDFPCIGGCKGVSSRVRACIDFYGPTDFTAPFARRGIAGDLIREFLGKTYADDRGLYTKASPIAHLAAAAPPTLIFHGTADDIVPIEQSAMLIERLKTLRIPCRLDPLGGWSHIMDLAAEADRALHEQVVCTVDAFLGDLSGNGYGARRATRR